MGVEGDEESEVHLSDANDLIAPLLKYIHGCFPLHYLPPVLCSPFPAPSDRHGTTHAFGCTLSDSFSTLHTKTFYRRFAFERLSGCFATDASHL